MTKIIRSCGHTILPRLLGPSPIIVDLGLDGGTFSREILARFPARIYAAEAVPQLYPDSFPDPRLNLLPIAVGGEDGSTIVNLYADRCSSISGNLPEETPASQHVVPLYSLGTFLRVSGFSETRIDLMKVDIEGAEVPMFEAATGAQLSQFTQISVEFHEFIYPELGERVRRIKKKLAGHGFWVVDFSRSNIDVLFVNRTALGRFDYVCLKSVVKYREGIKRRLATANRKHRLSSCSEEVDRCAASRES
jgi:FkbM family methyltransferase